MKDEGGGERGSDHFNFILYTFPCYNTEKDGVGEGRTYVY